MTLTIDQPDKPRVKRWTKREYNDYVNRGFFRDQRIYLYRGELIDVPPMGRLHARGIANISRWLINAFDPEHFVRIQSPFDAPGESMPEPDGAVVTPEQMNRKPHPNHALLLIEVSDSSVKIDQEKSMDYAAALVEDYWVLNMQDRQLEVYRQPVADGSAVLGKRYASHRIFTEADAVSPLASPGISVKVAELLRVT